MPYDFILDCSCPRDTTFNCVAIAIFTDNFLNKVNNNNWYALANIPKRYQNDDTVSCTFKDHFAYIKTWYREVVVAPADDPIKAKEDVMHKLQKSACTSWKGRVSNLLLCILYLLTLPAISF